MGKVFYLMGKSASGKDTMYQRLMESPALKLKPVVLYTTRPRRNGEQEGYTYYFVREKDFREMLAQGKVIEHRTYQTVQGNWTYFTAWDGQLDCDSEDNYLMMGTLESYAAVKQYLGAQRVIPLYLEIDNKERLLRAIHRESSQASPDYSEICRRYLADEQDFTPEKLEENGIADIYRNDDLEQCLVEIKERIRQEIGWIL